MISDEGMNEFIQKVAKATSSSYPNYIDSEDVAQHLWGWYLDNEHTVTKLIRGNESWQRMLYSTMAKTAHTFMQKQDAEVNGYSTDDVYQYSTAVVRTLLEDVFDYEDWQSFSTFGDGQPKSKRVGPTSDRIEMLIDVKRGLDELTERQYHMILWRYKFRFDNEMIAEAAGIKPVSVQKAVDRAVEALRRKLGKKTLTDMQNGWSERESRMSSAQALAYQESIY